MHQLCVLQTGKLPEVLFSFFPPLCRTLLFPQLIYSIRRLETQGPFGGRILFITPLFHSHFISVFSEFFKQTQKYGEEYSAYTNIVCVQKWEDRHTDTHTHTRTHKAPFRTRAYTDIKGSLFSHSYRYSTGGLCCEHIYVYAAVCFYERVWNHNVWRELLQTPSAPRACHTGLVCMCTTCLLFLCERLRDNGGSTDNAQRSRTIVPLTAFVCGGGGGETGNEIMLRALAVYVWSLSK